MVKNVFCQEMTESEKRLNKLLDTYEKVYPEYLERTYENTLFYKKEKSYEKKHRFKEGNGKEDSFNVLRERDIEAAGDYPDYGFNRGVVKKDDIEKYIDVKKRKRTARQSKAHKNMTKALYGSERAKMRDMLHMGFFDEANELV